MDGPAGWQETAEGYVRGSARAELRRSPKAFVILSFGDDATPDDAFAGIVGAMPFGKVVIRGDEPSRVLARALQGDGRVRFGPYAGLPYDAFGVQAVNVEARRAFEAGSADG